LWHPRVGVLTSADFRARVQDFIERPGSARMPVNGETLLIGAAPDGTWSRMRVRHRLIARSMVVGFIRLKKIDRLAIVIAGDASRQFRVAFAEREAAHAETGISDRRLAGLVAAAVREWSHPRALPGPMRTWFGRPYPIVVLVGVLCIELVPDLLRIPRALSGHYTWMPIIPVVGANLLFAAYMALLIATVVLLWSRSPIGYAAAGLLSAVQFVRPLILYVPLVHAYGLGTVELWVVWSWSYPALIWVMFGLLYMERLRRALAARGA
jgi:hypothetical protein